MSVPDTLSLDARRLYSHWSPEAWDQLSRGPAADLGLRLVGREDGDRLLRTYLALGREAVGLQYIDRRSFESDPLFLAALWIHVLPRLLPEVPAEQVGALLELAWNAGERLVREPAWLNRYLVSRLGELSRLDRLEGWLRESLAPVLQAPPAARWKGPLVATVLDSVGGGDDFLPGRIHLAAPTIACVHHRRAEDRQVAIHLRTGGRSVPLGGTPCFGEFSPPAEALPAVSFVANGVKVAGLVLELPRFGAEIAHAIAPAGFVVAASKSSQKVWVVESP